MTYDGSNRKDIRRAEKAARLAERDRIDYVKRIMSDTLGRAWLHRLLDSCHIFGEPFIRGAPDATAWNLGRQNVGKELFADVVNHCPTQYVMMMQEASQKEVEENVRHNRNDRTAAGERAFSEDPGRDIEGSEPGELDPFEDGAEA